MARLLDKLAEGDLRYCRGCGHDLLGLSDDVCPRCGRVNPGTRPALRPRKRTGTWVVLAVVAVGVTLAGAGLRYRLFQSQRPAATQPTTTPTRPVMQSNGSR